MGAFGAASPRNLLTASFRGRHTVLYVGVSAQDLFVSIHWTVLSHIGVWCLLHSMTGYTSITADRAVESSKGAQDRSIRATTVVYARIKTQILWEDLNAW